MKNRIGLSCLRVSVFGILAFLVLGISACKEKEQGIKPVYRDVTEAIYSTVTVQPRNSYKVYSKLPGIIDKLYVNEGDVVKKGDLILELTDAKSYEKIENAQLKYEIANEAYDGKSALLLELKNQIDNAQVKLTNDSITYERQKRLWEQNVGSRQDYDRKKLAYDLAKNDLSRLITTYQRNEEELKRQSKIAKNTLTLSKLDSKDLKVYAKMEGMVYSLSREEGESISSQTEVGVIGSKDNFILSLLVDEVDISKVYEGQKVVVALDAYENKVFDAKISKIYPEKDERSLTFKVEAEFITKPDRLFKGLSGEANIIVSVKEDVLTLPNQYINENSEVKTRDGVTAVKTGLKSLEFTEIVEGIDSNTVVKNFE